MQNTTRVVIADDSRRTRNGLRCLLVTCPGVDVVGEATDGWEAVELVAERRPDVVVMDAHMPGMDGLAATRAIKKRWPEVRVVVLTMYGARHSEAVSAGADAFLIKGCPPEELLDAIFGR
jgi:DNA-binding NarL/FixJ family response regulator